MAAAEGPSGGRPLWFDTARCLLCSLTGGVVLGISPVLHILDSSPMQWPNGQAAVRTGSSAWVLMFCLTTVLSAVIPRAAAARPIFLPCVPVSMGLAVLAAAAATQSGAALLVYLAMAPLAALSMAGFMYVQSVILVDLWASVGMKEAGASLGCGTQALGTLLFTLLPGVLVQFMEHEAAALYAYAAIVMALSMVSLLMASIGRPTEPTEVGMKDLSLKPPGISCEFSAQSDLTMISSETHSESGTGGFQAWKYLFSFHGGLYTSLHVMISVVGLGIKSLLTSIFLLLFPNLTFTQATVLSASSLALFVVLRTAAPWVTKRLNTQKFVLFSCSVGAVTLAFLPFVLSHNLTAWEFSGLMTIVNGVYAVSVSLLPLLGMMLFDVNTFPSAVGTSLAGQPLGGAAGVLVASYASTGTMSGSLNTTFLIFAGVWVAAGLVTLTLMWVPTPLQQEADRKDANRELQESVV